jgi:hypothetical protein
VTKKNQNRLWFAIAMGMLSFGIGMVIWTVKQATSLPVHESNDFMLKYQQADKNINSIMENKAKFDAKYSIELQNAEFITLEEQYQNSNSKRQQPKPLKLTKGANRFSYAIKDKNGNNVENAEFTFLLTRPYTQDEDQKENNVSVKNGLYVTKAFNINHKGRYTLQVKVTIDGLTGYLQTPAYLRD